jgi:hypothetical protein
VNAINYKIPFPFPAQEDPIAREKFIILNSGDFSKLPSTVHADDISILANNN